MSSESWPAREVSMYPVPFRTLEFPRVLTFSPRDAEETLRYLREMRSAASAASPLDEFDKQIDEGVGPETLVVDLSRTAQIDPDVALCLRAEADRLTHFARRPVFWIQPKSNMPTRNLNAVGFQWRANIMPTSRMETVGNLLSAPQVMSDGLSPFFRMQSGLEDGERILKIEKRLNSNLSIIADRAIFKGTKKDSSVFRDFEERIRVALNSVVFEVVYNTHKHAYVGEAGIDTESRDHRRSKSFFDWWIGIVSLSGEKRRAVHGAGDVLVVTALDHGLSIPESIRENISKGLAFIVTTPESSRALKEDVDVDMLFALINGRIRKAGSGVRSTGVDSLKALVDCGVASRMTLISGKALLRYETSTSSSHSTSETELSESFPGTLVSWEVPLVVEGGKK